MGFFSNSREVCVKVYFFNLENVLVFFFLNYFCYISIVFCGIPNVAICHILSVFCRPVILSYQLSSLLYFTILLEAVLLFITLLCFAYRVITSVKQQLPYLWIYCSYSPKLLFCILLIALSIGCFFYILLIAFSLLLPGSYFFYHAMRKAWEADVIRTL